MTFPGADQPLRVVALGGGHGLAASLGAVRRYANEITAIVSVADDGGSSGRLRDSYGVAPPGDLRKCLVALAEEGSVWSGAFEHRFSGGELDGHALGNLIIAGLIAETGSLQEALAVAGRLLGANGTVLAATTEPVVLKADVQAADGTGSDSVQGQVAVARAGRITNVSLVPADAGSPPEAVAAINNANQIVIGPGSLYTSILAVVVVPEIADALATTAARKVYVANLRTQIPETTGYDVAAHVDALAAHGLEIDVVLCHPGALPRGSIGVKCVEIEVASADGTVHDPGQLASALHLLVG